MSFFAKDFQRGADHIKRWSRVENSHISETYNTAFKVERTYGAKMPYIYCPIHTISI